jgi:GntR family transcriptional repressor for pyruvate dehydrogenase complex
MARVTAVTSTELIQVVLRPIRAHPFETCVEQLAAAIRLGVYLRGSTLPPERELASRMGVSRSTLREAIAALRSAGFVQTRRGRGGGTEVTWTASPSDASGRADLVARQAHFHDALVFRRVAEPGAAYIAATHDLTREQRDLLSGAFREVVLAPDQASHRQADSRFHLAIAAVTASPLTMRAVATVQSDLNDLLTQIPVLETNIAHSNRQHQSVLSAILRGDPTRARRAMESHCDATAALLRGLLGTGR